MESTSSGALDYVTFCNFVLVKDTFRLMYEQCSNYFYKFIQISYIVHRIYVHFVHSNSQYATGKK
jgi:hypothetical protein